MKFEALARQIELARRECDPRWPLRWRVHPVMRTELLLTEFPPGNPLAALDERVLGVPIAVDHTEPDPSMIEIEAQCDGVWIRPLSAKLTSHERSTIYAVSPLQDRAVPFSQIPFVDMPNGGPRVYTVLSAVPPGGLVFEKAMPRMRDDAIECVVYPRHGDAPSPPDWTDDPNPAHIHVKPWHFCAERWRSGPALMTLWRRIK